MSPPAATTSKASKTKLVLAFAALYTIWGSTYLAIKFAVETIPPYTMSAARFVVSGAILYSISRWTGSPAPTRREWRDGVIVGTLLLAGGNGAVGWAEQRVPSGITALLVASVPMWAVLIDWLRPHGKRPSPFATIGLLVGLAGVGILAAPEFGGATNATAIGAVVLTLGSISWAAGSIFSRQSARPASALMSTALQMLGGSVFLLLIAGLLGEAARFSASAISLKSFLGWAYLVTFGGLVGFTAYAYVLRETTPAKATTYAYVNPIVAVLLGWAFANEPITIRTIIAAGIILAGVAMISLGGSGEGERARGREGGRARGMATQKKRAAKTTRKRVAKRPAAKKSASLSAYNAKRDFTKTDEPEGRPEKTGTKLRFVIQKHAASHLHFDFRLELDGVMKSWAVPKGPSYDPTVKRLAMQVEDHPVEYNTFEGTIPKGQYGGGTVMIWDRGTYEPQSGEGEDAVREGYKRGDLKIVMHGERMQGSWVLVRTRRDPRGKNQWLLIKHRDHLAMEGADIVAAVQTSVVTGRTMEEIAKGDRVWNSNRK